MSAADLNSMTVIELRKLAKQMHVPLGAGILKSDIVAKLAAAMPAGQTEQEQPEAPAEPAAAEEEKKPAEPEAPAAADVPEKHAEPAPAQAAPAPEPVRPSAGTPVSAAAPAAPAQPIQFRSAWHNPGTRYSSRTGQQGAPQRMNSGWQTNPRQQQDQNDMPHIGTVRPVGFTPRFGPEAVTETPAAPREEYRGFRSQTEPAPVRRPYGEQPQQRPAYGQRPAYSQRPAYEQASAEQPQPAPLPFNAQEPGAQNPPLNELISPAECLDGSGVLELHPDGYGFLRTVSMLPSGKDIYVSAAQIRRFGLRTGDLIAGKTRPQREDDKYAAMLYVTSVNGQPAEDAASRPSFDSLTPVYPSRRIRLEGASKAVRMLDLMAPVGFGQRALMLCPPDTGKVELIRDLVNTIADNNPGTSVFTLLLDECPEDVTLFRDQVKGEVYASTFDQAPESHLRLAEMVLERASRLVEIGRDVVLIIDSLTQLSKTYTTAAAQQGRAVPGMVNPTSLFRAKKLFGAARATREAGTLTVFGIMDTDNGSKVDDAVVEEFKGTANLELFLDTQIARAGILPAIHVQWTRNRRPELLTNDAQQEGMKQLRGVINAMSALQAAQQVRSLVEKTASNDELYAKLKDWIAVSNRS